MLSRVSYTEMPSRTESGRARYTYSNMHGESRVLAAVRQHPRLTPHELVPHVYQDVSPHLFPLAERSLLAHLLKLEKDAAVVCEGDAWTGL